MQSSLEIQLKTVIHILQNTRALGALYYHLITEVFKKAFLRVSLLKKTHFRRKPTATNVILFSFLKCVTTAHKIKINRLT